MRYLKLNTLVCACQSINTKSLFYRYNVPWYQAPLHIQKLILFLLQRGNKAFTLNIGGLFTLSLECFASVRIYVDNIAIY